MIKSSLLPIYYCRFNMVSQRFYDSRVHKIIFFPFFKAKNSYNRGTRHHLNLILILNSMMDSAGE